MADRVSASITIGGNLPASLLSRFVEIAQAEGLSTDWDGPPFEPDDLPDGSPLQLMAHQVSWGHLRELEAFCTTHCLPYSRRSEAFPGQWGPELTVFDGRGAPRSYDIDERGQVVVSREVVDRLGIWEAIMAHFDAAAFPIPPLVVVSCTKETDNG